MKPQELKLAFVEMRAEGHSYQEICDKLHIAKATCTKWERELRDQIDRMKAEAMETLYESYHMTKASRIKTLGSTLESIETALESADLSEADPLKLMDMKLKYAEALKKEYTATAPAFTPGERIDGKAILEALASLLDRIRAGEVTADQASRESRVLSDLLKAYDLTEIRAKVDELEAVLNRRQ